jgi:ATP-dependent Lon protease
VLQYFASGANKILISISAAVDRTLVPPKLFAKFSISFYQNAEDTVFKALGIE